MAKLPSLVCAAHSCAVESQGALLPSHEPLAHALSQAIEDGIRHAGTNAFAVVSASLRRDKDERAELFDARGTLNVSGFPVDFTRLHGKGTCLHLPSYPWQRERHWFEPEGWMGLAARVSCVHSRLAPCL